jgi:hypothetical protein
MSSLDENFASLWENSCVRTGMLEYVWKTDNELWWGIAFYSMPPLCQMGNLICSLIYAGCAKNI